MSTIYTVSQLNQEIKDLLDAVPGYHNLFIQGEVSNYKAHASGHHYLTLKDENAAINAVMFRNDAMRLKFRLENGMKVIVKARVSSFPRTGQVQLYISEIVPDGAGALNLAFEQLKAKLASEGLFDAQHKKPISRFPNRIALVTSPTGAAVRDMIRILGRRWPLAGITVYPALVQGDEAPESICRALALANAIGEADIIICGRGGGSIEDLWAFNTEPVARAIFDSEIPVISAVGHEPDVTIADFVADLRAPTPSGAAELAVPDRTAYLLSVQQLNGRLRTAVRKQVKTHREQLISLQNRLQVRTPVRYIQEKRLLLDHMGERLSIAVSARLAREREKAAAYRQHLLTVYQSMLQKRRMHFVRAAATLDAISPLKVLRRGYSIVTGKRGVTVSDAEQLKQGDTLHIRFAKGSADCYVTETKEEKYNGRKNV